MSENLKIDPYGFREYDARWLYEKDINQAGLENLGKGFGTQIKLYTKKDNPRIIVGHDYRSYSEKIKKSLINMQRKKRIANGSGNVIQEVNKLMKQFNQTKKNIYGPKRLTTTKLG